MNVALGTVEVIAVRPRALEIQLCRLGARGARARRPVGLGCGITLQQRGRITLRRAPRQNRVGVGAHVGKHPALEWKRPVAGNPRGGVVQPMEVVVHRHVVDPRLKEKSVPVATVPVLVGKGAWK